MDVSAFDLVLFVSSTFLAALVAGLAGFAFGLVAAAVWLHVLTPVQTASLIVAFGIIVQGVAVWKLRHALQWARLWPFLLGGALGVPIGVMLLAWVDPGTMRLAIGAVLILYGAYALVHPAMQPIKRGGAAADAAVGMLNGILGGATGLAGIIVTIWCGVRGWPKDVQRTVFQPVGVAIFMMSAACLGTRGQIGREVIWLFVMGLPALAAGTWLGLKLYGRLDEFGLSQAGAGVTDGLGFGACPLSAMTCGRHWRAEAASSLEEDGHASHWPSVGAGRFSRDQRSSASPANETLQSVPRVSASVPQKSYARRVQ